MVLTGASGMDGWVVVDCTNALSVLHCTEERGILGCRTREYSRYCLAEESLHEGGNRRAGWHYEVMNSVDLYSSRNT